MSSKKEDLYFNLGTKKKKNLLLVVSSNSVFHYKISGEESFENYNEIIPNNKTDTFFDVKEVEIYKIYN